MDGPRQVVVVMPPLWARVLGALVFLAVLGLALLIAIPFAILGLVVVVVMLVFSALGRLVGAGPREERRNVRVIERGE